MGLVVGCGKTSEMDGKHFQEDSIRLNSLSEGGIYSSD